jgi:hypothetical protein
MELNTTTLAIFAIFAVMGLVGVVAVTIISVAEDAESKGCRTSQSVNASKGRCIQ